MNRLLVVIVIGILLLGVPAPSLAVDPDYGVAPGYGESIEEQRRAWAMWERRPSHVPGIPQDMEEEWRKFEERYGNASTLVRWAWVRWDFSCVCVRELYGWYDSGRGEIKSKADAEALARSFLSENAGLLKISVGDIEVSGIKIDGRGVWHVNFVQKYQGLPVYGGGVKVLITNRGEISNVINNFHPGINIPILPAITREQAAKIATYKNRGYSVSIDKMTLFVLPDSKNSTLVYRLAWRVSIQTSWWNFPTRTLLYFIDALSGEVLCTSTGVVYGGGEATRDTGIEAVDLTRTWQSKVTMTIALVLIFAFLLRRWG